MTMKRYERLKKNIQERGLMIGVTWDRSNPEFVALVTRTRDAYLIFNCISKYQIVYDCRFIYMYLVLSYLGAYILENIISIYNKTWLNSISYVEPLNSMPN